MDPTEVQAPDSAIWSSARPTRTRAEEPHHTRRSGPRVQAVTP